jgi:hypothetical protein
VLSREKAIGMSHRVARCVSEAQPRAHVFVIALDKIEIAELTATKFVIDEL